MLLLVVIKLYVLDFFVTFVYLMCKDFPAGGFNVRTGVKQIDYLSVSASLCLSLSLPPSKKHCS